MDPIWLPVPQQWRRDGSGQRFSLQSGGYIRLGQAAPGLTFAAERLQRRLAATHRVGLELAVGGPRGDINAFESPTAHREGYQLHIRPQGIDIRGDAAGVFYAFATLTQLIAQYGTALPCLSVEDWPRFGVRGVMLDISRTKVPRLETLYAWIDALADLKINHLQLYLEDAFAYRGHPLAWAGLTPLTGQDVVDLDAYCRMRHIDLVPNQNVFGHLTRWLVLPAYAHLAECPQGAHLPAGDFPSPWSLNATDPESVQFAESLLNELLPYFSSPYCNIGCDETFDLGQGKSRQACESVGRGRVYLEFLRQVSASVGRHGKEALYWADMISRHHPDLVGELPDDGIALEWGYEKSYPFESRVARLANAGKRFITCPSTSTWLSLLGRTGQALENTARAARAADQAGGLGVVTTEWGDWGHWQPLSVAELGIAALAAEAWHPASGLGADFTRALSLHGFGDASGEMGRAVYELGRITALAGGAEDPESGYFAPLVDLLARPWHWPERWPLFSLAALTEAKRALKTAAEAVAAAPLARPDAWLVRREYGLMTTLALLAVEIAIRGVTEVAEPWPDLSAGLEQVLASYRELWLERNRSGGLQESLAYFAPLAERLQSGPNCRFASLAASSRLLRYPL